MKYLAHTSTVYRGCVMITWYKPLTRKTCDHTDDHKSSKPNKKPPTKRRKDNEQS